VKIPGYVLNAMKKLNDAGNECYLVGGCVRDTLMGTTPHDYDLTTSALPEQMLSVFADCKIIETGIKHGTVTLLTDGGPVEITTYRIDGEYKDNRRPENVAFTPNLSEDLARRDFTVNAIAMDTEGNTVDLYGGKADIINCIIRCVGEPQKRFNEDGLRILRALRFASVLNFQIDFSTATAIHQQSHLLGGISAERVREELFKLICGVAAPTVMLQFAEVILPFLPQITAQSLQSYTTLIDRLPQSAEIRLAALYALHSNENGLKTAMQGLKTSNKQLKSAVACCEIITSPPTDAAQTALLVGRLGETDFQLYLNTAKLCGKDISATLQNLSDLKIRNACYTLSELALTGNDLIELGVQGKRVGQTLELLFAAVAEGKVKNEKIELLNYIKKQLLPNRKTIRLKEYDYNTPGAYFITVCTESRKNILWNKVGADIIRPQNIPLSKTGQLVKYAIEQIIVHYDNISVDNYCIMPNHIHLLLSITTDDSGRIISAPTISNVVGSLKRWVSKQCGKPIWQKSFYDHIIRNQNDYSETYNYIDNNPIKWIEDEFYTE